ncbi:MAG TPA: membrane dipeptidase, partial [Erythrobacter sp.]|nr:membrane dipeptidase [Erythrobacter sp.]
MQRFAASRIALAATLALASPLAAQDAPVDAATATANAALDAAPIFDGHNDVPNQLRARVANQINGFDFEDTLDTGETHPQGAVMQTDLARLKQGKVGAQFWSVYVPSNPDEPEAVQQVIEQIDVTKRLIARYPDGLRFATTADQV